MTRNPGSLPTWVNYGTPKSILSRHNSPVLWKQLCHTSDDFLSWIMSRHPSVAAISAWRAFEREHKDSSHLVLLINFSIIKVSIHVVKRSSPQLYFNQIVPGGVIWRFTKDCEGKKGDYIPCFHFFFFLSHKSSIPNFPQYSLSSAIWYQFSSANLLMSSIHRSGGLPLLRFVLVSIPSSQSPYLVP